MIPLIVHLTHRFWHRGIGREVAAAGVAKVNPKKSTSTQLLGKLPPATFFNAM